MSRLSSDNIQDIYALSPMQEGMYFHFLYDRSSPVYFLQNAYRLHGELNVPVVEKSLNVLVNRYEILRTVFNHEKMNRPLQVVLKEHRMDFQYIDYRGRDSAEKERLVTEFKEADKQRTFDLTNEVPMRVAILQVEDDSCEFTWSFHHILMDGWCTRVLIAEYFEIYNALLRDKTCVLPEVKPYRTFIQWLEKQDKEEPKTYWKTYLDAYEETAGIAGKKALNEAEKTYKPEHAYFTLEEEATGLLNKKATRRNATVNTFLQTAWGILLARYNDTRDVVFGAVVSGRPAGIDGVETMVGLFINTVPVRIRCGNGITFAQLLQKNQEKAVQSEPYHYYPLADIQALGSLKHHLFDHIMGFEHFPVYRPGAGMKEADKSAGEHTLTAVNMEEFGQTNYDFNIVFIPGQRLTINFQYNANVFDSRFIDAMGNHFMGILEQVMADEHVTVDELDLLSEEERRRILFTFNDTGTPYPADSSIDRLFERQAALRPDSIAAVREDRQVTYRQLNREAGRWARLLRSKGVKPDTIVGIMVDHSIELVVGLLAILKAGGAYVPIDAGTPRNRVKAILDDCGAAILLSTTRETGKYTYTDLQDFCFIDLKPHVTTMRPQLKDFSGLPIPDRGLVDYQQYNRFIGLALVKNNITLQATRGCPYNCAYCHKIWPKSHVHRSAEDIFAEVKLYYDMGVRRFTFIDDVFNLNIKNSRRFFQLIIDNGLDLHMLFPACLRGDIMTKEYIDLMVRAGAASLALALETASPRLQKLIGKHLHIEKFRENIEYVCQEHPHVIIDLFTMHGFPTETEEEALMTLDFIERLKWVHFPLVNILKIYRNTDMEKLALENGISNSAITRSENLAYHELPETLPFPKAFTLKYQAEFFNGYFLSRERLLHVLPHQMALLTEDEIVQKYDSYIPRDIRSFDDLLGFLGISRDELPVKQCLDEGKVSVPDFNEKLSRCFPAQAPGEDALRVLLLDTSQFFSGSVDMLFDVVEAPLGLMYLLTYLKHCFGNKINGKIAKSRIDFNNYEQLQDLLDRFKPDVIGIRSLTFFKDPFHRAAALIRQWGFAGPIIAGGPYATSDYKRVLRDRNIDLVVMGEGELTFAEVIENIMQNNGKLPADDVLEGIKGIAFMPGKEKEAARRGCSREVLMLDQPVSAPAAGQDEPLNPGGRSRDLAYAIFTSGSTGKPKGVLVDHRSVVRLVKNTNFVTFEAGERLLQTGAVAFDASTFEMWGALLNGLTLHLVSKTDILTPGRLKEIIAKSSINTMWMTSPLFNRMLETDIELFTGLTNLLVGGDELSPVHINKLRDRFPALNIINGYGPTENTTFSVTHLIDREYRENIPIGKPIANSTAYILDRSGHSMPAGVPGHLCVGGHGVSRGYLNDPPLTRERFMKDPFSQGGRLYRTGDRASWLPGGVIEFLGRLDRQMKIRGFRIELGEIETRLLMEEYIKEALVTGVASVGGEGDDKLLCAYIVSEQEIDYRELRGKLSEHLPDYMIPSYYIRLDKIPLTVNGKVDWKALPGPGAGVRGETYAAPRDDVERRLAGIWSEVLGVRKENIGIDANFFDLGGHSLKVTILATKIHKEFNVKVPLEEIFMNPGIRELAGYIKSAARVDYTAVRPAPQKKYYALSSSQKRMYFVQQMNWEGALYNVSMTEVLEGGVDRTKLEQAFKALIERHEGFRTSFEMKDEAPVQVIHDNVELRIRYFETSPGNGEQDARDILRNWVKPFDLSRPPLLRVGLIEMNETRHILLIDMPHIITDGISNSILIRDFMVLYPGGTLPGIPLQYKDYAEWQKAFLESPAMKKQEEYWLSRFSGDIPVLSLPTDYPRPAKRRFEGSSIRFEIDRQLTEKIKKLAAESETTLFIVLLAVYTILLYKYTGQEDIVVATGVAGRTHADLQHVIGMFINMLPMRNRPGENISFERFLEDVRENAVKAYENQDYPFDELVRKLKLREQGGRHPVFDTVFEWIDPASLGMGTQEANDDAVRRSPAYGIEHKVARYDLVVVAVEAGGTIEMNFEYSTSLFKSSTIEKMGQRCLEILEQVLENKKTALKDIEMSHEYIEAKPSSIQAEFGF
jgi:amino acid adenylation domain-containing protein